MNGVDSIGVVFSVQCVFCEDGIGSYDLPANKVASVNTRTKFAAHLLSMGWHYTKGDGWICNECWPNRKVLNHLKNNPEGEG